jgi:hypothetical protein
MTYFVWKHQPAKGLCHVAPQYKQSTSNQLHLHNPRMAIQTNCHDHREEERVILLLNESTAFHQDAPLPA